MSSVIPSTRQKTGRASLVDLNLPQLQNFIKRDPISYKDDFLRQYHHFESSLEIFKLQPSVESKSFCEVVAFLSHVVFCYPAEAAVFSKLIMDLLKTQHAVCHPEVRKSLVQACLQLRSGKMIDEITLLSLLFSLLKCRDKSLRASISTYIQAEIKRANAKATNQKLNKSLQNHIFTLVAGDSDSSDGSDIAAFLSVEICIELYRKQVWNDAKTVSILAEALFSPSQKVMVKALNFFLGNNLQDAEKDDDEDADELRQMQFRATITKNSRKEHVKMEKVISKVKKREKKADRAEAFNFSALHLLNDPQGLAEKLFKRMASRTHTQENGAIEKEIKFEIKLLMMNVISRIIGIHKLIVLNFYPFLLRYMKAQQQDVTVVLAVCAQATHDMVPPDAIEPMLRAIIDNFVTDAYAPEVISAGINAIREIASRSPLAMDPELMSYLVTFKTHRDKGVSIAGRSLIALFREIAPELLPKKERGKVASMGIASGKNSSLVYGQQSVASGVEGIELLLEKGDDDEGHDEDFDKEDEASDKENGGRGWINVSDGEGDINLDEEETVVRTGRSRLRARLGLDAHKKDESEAEDDDESADDNESTLDDYEVVDECEIEDEDQADDDVQEGEEEPKKDEPRIETTRFLTSADFAKLKQLQQEKKADEIVNPKGKGTKRSRSPSGTDLVAETDNVISTRTIEGYRKKKRMNKEERLATVMEGREGREKFGSRKGKDHGGSTTNRTKSKQKNNMMMVHKRDVVLKKKLSLREKQSRLRKHIVRIKTLKM